MADSSCVTNESNCVPSKSFTLTNKTNELTTIKSQYLFFDGLIYRWKGDLTYNDPPLIVKTLTFITNCTSLIYNNVEY